LFVLLLLLPAFAFGSSKALLIGIGVYKEPGHDLPGIDLDVQRMHRIALSMGFAETQIHTLQDRQATLGGIEGELRSWFRQGVGPNDHLLLYFSSHGSLVPGPNGPVGAICPHDVHVASDHLENVLTGPTLSSLLESNPSHNIVLIVDACHSGGLTSSKAIGRAFVAKVLRYPGMPSGDLQGDLFTAGEATKAVGEPNYGYMSACRRDQVAAATKQGSVLTLAMEEGWNRLRQAKQRASLEAVHPLALGFIQANGINQQNPELYGDPNLLKADWFGAPQATSGTSGAWAALEQIAQQAAGPLRVGISRPEYRKNELLDISAEVPRDGYLFVLSVGEGDEKPVLLFPNQWQKDNHMAGGATRIPTAGANWHIRQGLPSGMSRQNVLLVVVLSHSADNLKDLLSGNGPFKDIDLGEGATRSPFVEEAATASGYLAAKLTYSIKE
jgi:hypothetical protein